MVPLEDEVLQISVGRSRDLLQMSEVEELLLDGVELVVLEDHA